MQRLHPSTQTILVDPNISPQSNETMNMKIGHMALPSTWTVTFLEAPVPTSLPGWWSVQNDVDGVVAYFRKEEDAKAYHADAIEARGSSED